MCETEGVGVSLSPMKPRETDTDAEVEGVKDAGAVKYESEGVSDCVLDWGAAVDSTGRIEAEADTTITEGAAEGKIIGEGGEAFALLYSERPEADCKLKSDTSPAIELKRIF